MNSRSKHHGWPEALASTRQHVGWGSRSATLGNWVRKQRQEQQEQQEQPSSFSEAGNGAVVLFRRPVSELDVENSRLRKELASAKLDIEILRKATAYFAKGSR